MAATNVDDVPAALFNYNFKIGKFPEREALPTHKIADRLHEFNLTLDVVSVRP